MQQRPGGLDAMIDTGSGLKDRIFILAVRGCGLYAVLQHHGSSGLGAVRREPVTELLG